MLQRRAGHSSKTRFYRGPVCDGHTISATTRTGQSLRSYTKSLPSSVLLENSLLTELLKAFIESPITVALG